MAIYGNSLPDQTGNSGKYLTTNGSVASWGTLTSNTPGGSSGDIQYNNAGAFGGITPGTGVVTFLSTPSSANLRAALTDETGTGAAVFATSPTLVTPTLGAAVASSFQPASDSATAVRLFKADGTTVVGTWDTTNKRLTIADNITSTSGNLIASAGNVQASMSTGFVHVSGPRLLSPLDGVETFNNNAVSAGIRFQFAAAPTVSSGFGSSPSITSGSTDTAGSVNVGTGSVATSGVIAFATTWASAPFCIVMNTTTGILQRATTTTTQLTITSALAWTASDVIVWLCIGSK